MLASSRKFHCVICVYIINCFLPDSVSGEAVKSDYW